MKTFISLPLLGATLIHASQKVDVLDSRQSSAAITITVPRAAPDSVSDVVDHAYPALAIAQHSFQEYAGNKSSPNSFSANLIQGIASRTGSPVHIRVGGTSGDFSYYNESQTETALILPQKASCGGIPHGIQIGPSWFEGFATLPGKYTYMTHLANNTDGYQANSAAASREALKYITNANLDALEIGNEINFYPGVNRPSTYSLLDYLREWKSYANSITTAIGNIKVSFQAPVFYINNGEFTTAKAFDAGQDSQGFTVGSTSLHHYMSGDATSASALQSNYMNHTNIAAQLDVFIPVVSWLRSNKPNIPLHLGEVNSNLHSKGNADVLGVFGSALWLADYLLYGATLNIKRMNVQQSSGFSYASWRPVEYCGAPPAVNPPYYAHPFVADIIGNSGNVRIADLKLGQDTLSGYAVYDADSGSLRRVVLLNLKTWRTTDLTPRPSSNVILDIGTTYTGTATVDRLTAPGADVQDASKISWKGISWTYASNGKPFQGPSTSSTIRGNGYHIGPVSIKASEAIVVTL